MLKRMLFLLCAAAMPLAAQTCDVTYTSDVDVVLKTGSDPVNFGMVPAVANGVPMADVLDNNRIGQKLIRELGRQDSKVDRKGVPGPYIVTYSEMRICDGGVPVRADGAFAKGVTAAGLTKLTDVGIEVAKEINDRTKKRVARGDRFVNDHSKARAVKRDPNTGKRERDKIVAGD